MYVLITFRITWIIWPCKLEYVLYSSMWPAVWRRSLPRAEWGRSQQSTDGLRLCQPRVLPTDQQSWTQWQRQPQRDSSGSDQNNRPSQKLLNNIHGWKICLFIWYANGIYRCTKP